jgi:hypothetical protein
VTKFAYKLRMYSNLIVYRLVRARMPQLAGCQRNNPRNSNFEAQENRRFMWLRK